MMTSSLCRSLGAALVLVAAFAIPPGPSRAAEPFTINAIVPETGAASFLGQEEVQALNAVEALVNKSGGISGRPIKFAVVDDQSSPQTAVQLLNGIMARKPGVVLGSSFTSTCSAIAPLVASGPVEYCFSPGVHPPPGSYQFSGSNSTTDLLKVASIFFHESGWTKIAVITSTDATGQDADRGIAAAFNAENGETIVDHEHFNISDVSVAAQLARIKASGAQALIAWSTGTPFGTVLRGAKEAALTIPILTTTGNLTYAQMKAYAAFMTPNLYFAAAPFIAPDQVTDPAVRRAVEAFVNAFKPTGVKPDVGQSLAWDPALLVVDVLKHVGLDASATKIRDYLNHIGGKNPWVGIYGKYDFTASPQRGLGTAGVEMVRWDPSKEAWIAASTPGGHPLKPQ